MATLLGTILVSVVALSPPERSDWSGIPDDGEESPSDASLLLIERLTRHLFHGLDDDEAWQEQAEYATAAVERVFERQGWDSESDAFSLDLIRKVQAIPPWRAREQFDAVTGGLSERYALDEEQETYLHGLLVRETTQLFGRHALELLPLMGEALQMRFAGEPFTTEQVTRWTRTLDPVFYDLRARLDEASLEFLDQLEPGQQERVARDLLAANRRLDRVEELGAQWWHGEWAPADWGLDTDPIQQGLRPPRPDSDDAGPPEVRRPARAERSVDSSSVMTTQPSTDTDAWARYVRAFIVHYSLGEAQQQRAWIIYERARGQRDLQRRRYDRRIERHEAALAKTDDENVRKQLTGLEESWRKTSELIFDTLKRRLDRLLTRAQRARATSRPAETPAVTPKPVPADLSGP